MNPSDTIIQLVVTQSVGNTKRLNVHRGILCKSSNFFKNAMKPEWTDIQAGPNTIDLSDDRVDIVSNYVKWLYYDTIPNTLYEEIEDPYEERTEEAEKVLVALAEAYVFGEKIVDVRYKNAILQTICTAEKALAWIMGPESVKIVYEGTPPKSPLRRFIAENIAYTAHDDSLKSLGWMQFFDECPREVLVDALKIMVKVRASHNDSKPGVESYLEEE